ncbi:MAG TPA: NAD(P)H-hydrate dehydratase [Sphingomicrobium sp.]
MRPILTAEQMRAAEQAAIDGGTGVEELMERAGAALAEAVYRYAGPLRTLILCGPGNNGGDGYVAARHLAERGVEVRVAALSEPKSDAARWARSQWDGAVEALSDATSPAPVVIDALFGTGLKRGLEPSAEQALSRLCGAAQVRVACDVPSGVDSDSGAELGQVSEFDLTVAFGALKPAHRLFPALSRCGRVVLADIGIAAGEQWHEIGPPRLPPIPPDADKYRRGLVSILTGHMPGATVLSATAAAKAGAGTVRLYADQFLTNVAAAIVQGREWEPDAQRHGCLLIGPGLGQSERAQQRLAEVLRADGSLVLDADALRLLRPEDIAAIEAPDGQPPIVTPHGSEFEHLFGEQEGSKAEQALAGARLARAVVVYKGPDTVVAAPDGRVAFAPPAPHWLASAGTGDVLAGITAAMRARGLDPFEAACAAVWLHGRSAEIAGPHMIADDLAAAIPEALDLAR